MGLIERLQEIRDWLMAWAPSLGRAGLEVLILWVLIYGFLRVMQGTRGAGVLKGLAMFGAVLLATAVLFTRWFQLSNLDWALRSLAPVILIPLFILFQPEIRRALVHFGQNPVMRLFFRSHVSFTDELVKAAFSLSRDRIGGLIAIEREVHLHSYAEAGVRLDAEVSAELIKTLFWPGTPLHDGAVVIRQQRIAAAGCLFPLTDNPAFSTELGTRHRAAVGVTEESDAAAIVVSEQTGEVSLAVGGALRRNVDEKTLRQALEELAAEPATRM